ncbi:hypothetical protein CQJ94_10720 [Glycomyces fuscus]|nr:hypothetical protein CQJ94_10720 [Glycomyces fuscus]
MWAYQDSDPGPHPCQRPFDRWNDLHPAPEGADVAPVRVAAGHECPPKPYGNPEMAREAQADAGVVPEPEPPPPYGPHQAV